MTKNIEAIQIDDSKFDNLRKKFSATEDNYQILRGDRQAIRSRNSVWDTDFMLSEYTKFTDQIIGMLDGSIKETVLTDSNHPELVDKAPGSVIYLDKSARPVSWMVDALWDQFAKPGSVKPKTEFLNIDRVNWFIRQGMPSNDAASRLGPDDFKIEDVPQEDIDRIRALFVEGEIQDRSNWKSEIWNMTTRLDGQKVLIIDEVKNKGGTLSIACQLLRKAIPEAAFDGDYFWQSEKYAIDKKGSEIQMGSAPVWYDNESQWGRGVGDISKDYYDRLYERDPSDENFKRKLGWSVLSAPHFKRVRGEIEVLEDVAAKKLEQDIAYLSYAVADGNVPRQPSGKRELAEMKSIIHKQIPPGYTFPEYAAYRGRRAQQNSPK